MSFLNINDPKKRDEIVQEYLATVKRLQHRDIEQRAQDLTRSENLHRVFEPVIESGERAAATVTKELVPIQTGLKTINDHLLLKKKYEESQKQHSNIVDRYLNQYENTKVLDRYFGIQRDDGGYIMGTKSINIDNHNNLVVDGIKYDGTTGLWALIMMNDPPTKKYSSHDVQMYADLVNQTSVMNHPHNIIPGKSRYKQTRKWALLQKIIVDQQKNTEKSDDEDEKNPDTSGSGIQFLPGDIKGMQNRLTYLLAEYRAGNNKSTRNEIVPILDELLRRRRISRKEYRDINSFLDNNSHAAHN